MQGLKRLDREEIGDTNTADLRDASYVVAHQVDNHQILLAEENSLKKLHL